MLYTYLALGKADMQALVLLKAAIENPSIQQGICILVIGWAVVEMEPNLKAPSHSWVGLIWVDHWV